MTESNRQFVQFQLLRIEPSFQSLEINERVVAKQQFQAVWETWVRRVLCASYFSYGLRADCDAVLWRVSDSLDQLQEMSARLHEAGFGRYLSPCASFLGVLEGRLYAEKPESGQLKPGAFPYLFLRPGGALPPGSKSDPKRVLVHPAYGHGLDDTESLLVVEAQSPEDFLRLFPEGATAGHQTFPGALKDMRDIADMMG